MSLSMPRIDAPGPIVVVDDDDTEIVLLRSYLEFTPIRRDVFGFTAGQSFLDYLDEVEEDAQPMPSVVLLDIRMPYLDGYDILREIKSRDRFRVVPVVLMFSNSKDEADVTRSFELGADGYQVKPANQEEYLAFFNRLFGTA